MTNIARTAPVDQLRPLTPIMEGAAITPHFVLNASSIVAQSNPLDIYNIFLEDAAPVPDDEYTNVYQVAAPAGAKYLVLSHAWKILADPGTATDPTTLPIVRVFGLLPSFTKNPPTATPFQSAANHDALIPATLVAPQPPLLTHTADWHALSNLNTDAYTHSLGSLSAPTAVWEHVDAAGNIYRRSATKTVHLRGCQKVAVTVSTAAVGPSSGAIIGTFEF